MSKAIKMIDVTIEKTMPSSNGELSLNLGFSEGLLRQFNVNDIGMFDLVFKVFVESSKPIHIGLFKDTKEATTAGFNFVDNKLDIMYTTEKHPNGISTLITLTGAVSWRYFLLTIKEIEVVEVDGKFYELVK